MRSEYHTELEKAANERHRMKEIDVLNDRREDKSVSEIELSANSFEIIGYLNL